MKNLIKTISFFSLAIAITLTSCSGSSGSGGSGPVPQNCVSLPAGDVAWTYEECGPFPIGDLLEFMNTQEGYDASGSKKQIGAMSIEKGHITFKYTNLDWSDFVFPSEEQVIMNFIYQNEAETVQSDWHMFGIRWSRDGTILTKFVSQRFDGVCYSPEPMGKCKREVDEYNAPQYDRNKTYRYDFKWDTTVPSMIFGDAALVDGLIEARIYDATNPKNEVLISTFRVPTMGPFFKFNSFHVGGRVGQHWGKPALFAVMTDVRITFFK